MYFFFSNSELFFKTHVLGIGRRNIWEGSGKQLFLSWIQSSLASARTQPVNSAVGRLTWKLVSSLFILYLINIYGEAVCRVLYLLQTCLSICLVNFSMERDCQGCKLNMSKTKLSWPSNLFSRCLFSQYTMSPSSQMFSFSLRPGSHPRPAFPLAAPHLFHQLSDPILFPTHTPSSLLLTFLAASRLIHVLSNRFSVQGQH